MSNKQSDRHTFYIDDRQPIEAVLGSLDIIGADNVEVQIDRDRLTLWVNASKRCMLRICNIRGHYEYIDLRASEDHSELYERAMANEERIRRGLPMPSIMDTPRERDRIAVLHRCEADAKEVNLVSLSTVADTEALASLDELEREGLGLKRFMLLLVAPALIAGIDGAPGSFIAQRLLAEASEHEPPHRVGIRGGWPIRRVVADCW